MESSDANILSFCEEIILYINDKRNTPPEFSGEIRSSESDETLEQIKKTQLQLFHAIHQLIDSQKQGGKLLNLYVIDETLYNLHRQINQKEQSLVKKLCQFIKKSLLDHQQVMEKSRKEAEARYSRADGWNDTIRFMCYLIAIVSTFAAFAYPSKARLYLWIILFCLAFTFLIGDAWKKNARQKRDRIFELNDPKIIESALAFLTPQSITTLLEPPSFSSKYQELFFQMLINLAISNQWAAREDVHFDDLMESAKIAFDKAYSNVAPHLISETVHEWKEEFEEIQAALHEHFKDSFYALNIKSRRDPLYFLSKYSEIATPSIEKKLKKFIAITKSIL